MTWCDARMDCMARGADLLSVTSDVHFGEVRNYLKSLGLQQDFYVALKKVDNSWMWLLDGRSPGADHSGDWYFNSPSGENGFDCAMLAQSYGYLAVDMPCDKIIRPLCQLHAPPGVLYVCGGDIRF
ncbi:uncharacterized protein LOC125178195 [Hyalella azteca]|uniref:Uncharacterized protein LOC125178195 n=1 Tax=Hyalella azteca TaxID=294128 RepID=A0A979FK22_HYAAZ|nr:uncharacterized protein LOC125178195 [Hyalella azteca]